MSGADTTTDVSGADELRLLRTELAAERAAAARRRGARKGWLAFLVVMLVVAALVGRAQWRTHVEQRQDDRDVTCIAARASGMTVPDYC